MGDFVGFGIKGRDGESLSLTKATKVSEDKYQAKEGGTGYFRNAPAGGGSPHFFIGEPGSGQLAGGAIQGAINQGKIDGTPNSKQSQAVPPSQGDVVPRQEKPSLLSRLFGGKQRRLEEARQRQEQNWGAFSSVSQSVRTDPDSEGAPFHLEKTFNQMSAEEQGIVSALALFTAGSHKEVRNPPKKMNKRDIGTMHGGPVNPDGSNAEIQMSPEAYARAHKAIVDLASAPYESDKPVHRGMKLPKEMVDQLKIGDSLNLSPISSWSTEPDIAQKFAGLAGGNEHAVVLNMVPKTGTDISGMSYYGSEKEFLTGGKIKVAGKREVKKADGKIEIHLDVEHTDTPDPLVKGVDGEKPDYIKAIEEALLEPHGSRYHDFDQQEPGAMGDLVGFGIRGRDGESLSLTKATKVGEDKYQAKEGGTGYFRNAPAGGGSPHFFIGEPGSGQLAGGAIQGAINQGKLPGGEGGAEDAPVKKESAFDRLTGKFRGKDHVTQQNEERKDAREKLLSGSPKEVWDGLNDQQKSSFKQVVQAMENRDMSSMFSAVRQAQKDGIDSEILDRIEADPESFGDMIEEEETGSVGARHEAREEEEQAKERAKFEHFEDAVGENPADISPFTDRGQKGLEKLAGEKDGWEKNLKASAVRNIGGERADAEKDLKNCEKFLNHPKNRAMAQEVWDKYGLTLSPGSNPGGRAIPARVYKKVIQELDALNQVIDVRDAFSKTGITLSVSTKIMGDTDLASSIGATGIAGVYRSQENRVEVTHRNTGSSTLIHELFHALDHERKNGYEFSSQKSGELKDFLDNELRDYTNRGTLEEAADRGDETAQKQLSYYDRPDEKFARMMEDFSHAAIKETGGRLRTQSGTGKRATSVRSYWGTEKMAEHADAIAGHLGAMGIKVKPEYIEKLKSHGMKKGLELVGIDDLGIDPSGFQIFLVKGRSHKYLKRELISEKPRKYRYWYKHPREGLVTDDSLHVGARFRHGQGEAAGHYEITATHSDGKVSVRHDETGEERTLTVGQLRDAIHTGQHEHDEGVGTPEIQGRKLLDNFVAAMKHGSPKQKEARRREFLQHANAYPASVAGMTQEFLEADKASRRKLQEVQNGGTSTFTAVKSIKTKGRGEDKRKYGGQKVQVQVEHVPYAEVIRRSRDQMNELPEGRAIQKIMQKTGVPEEIAREAYQEVKASLSTASAGATGATWTDPLKVDGKSVPGFQVYSGSDKGKQGNVYVAGLVKNEAEVDEALGKPPTPNKNPKTRAKEALRSMLDVGSWRQYRVNAGGLQDMSHQAPPRGGTQEQEDAKRRKAEARAKMEAKKKARIAARKERAPKETVVKEPVPKEPAPKEPKVKKPKKPKKPKRVKPKIWGIRWKEFGKNDRTRVKEKFFTDADAREKFSQKLEDKDNFASFEAWSDPPKAVQVAEVVKDHLHGLGVDSDLGVSRDKKSATGFIHDPSITADTSGNALMNLANDHLQEIRGKIKDAGLSDEVKDLQIHPQGSNNLFVQMTFKG
jgi:hypothetical protein